ncbi:MAG: hypothetical protein ACXADW_21005 [Candidatus Hodarchaeales archaeon]|jgi:hypothetical protein
MKVHSLTILHYGADYLSSALRSIYHSVDQCHIFYTPTPSHGHSTNIPPIETREELRQAAYAYDPDYKVKWYDMHGIKFEGNQRDLALATVEAAGADIVVVVDCDEIWPDKLLNIFLDEMKNINARNWLVNMIHFWRSFNWGCYDEGWPVRIIDLRFNEGTQYLSKTIGQVYHFGYAVTDRVMNYKWQIHGHKNELRPNWFSTHWAFWPPLDNCHPTNGRNEEGKPFWIPEPFDKNKLPEFMRQHPFWGLEKIE